LLRACHSDTCARGRPDTQPRGCISLAPTPDGMPLQRNGLRTGILGRFWVTEGKTLRRTGPYSRSAQLAKPKRRTRESRFLEQTRADLTAHLGGAPSMTQALMIERIVMTLLRIELMDRDALQSDTPRVITERQSRDYLAWVNTAGRLLRSLGLEPAKPAKRDPFELIAAINGARHGDPDDE
jgi:hypothetical protein